MDLLECMTRIARQALDRGETAEEIEKQAQEQENSGFPVTASYTRLQASTMRRLAANLDP